MRKQGWPGSRSAAGDRSGVQSAPRLCEFAYCSAPNWRVLIGLILRRIIKRTRRTPALPTLASIPMARFEIQLPPLL